MKKINEAYQVIGKPESRVIYDKIPTECPVCDSCEVIQTTDVLWRCRHCGCKFDPSRPSEVLERVEKEAVSQRLRQMIYIFQTTQCSWCSVFYTQPFLCPHGKLQSDCGFFHRLDEAERAKLLGDEKWWWRIGDMLQQVQEKGVLAKCRQCFALNPNPRKNECWYCGGKSLCCPACREAPVLKYDIQQDVWKCPGAGCSKKFVYRPKKRTFETSESPATCPDCGTRLEYDARSQVWKCEKCESNRSSLDRHIAEEKKEPVSPGKKETSGGAGKISPARRRLISNVLSVLYFVGLIVIAITIYNLLGKKGLAGILNVWFLVIVVGLVVFLFWMANKLRSPGQGLHK